MTNKSEGENKIIFIDRKKSKPLFTNFYVQFSKYLLAKNYKEEKVLFRILYDKIYRPELFNFILKGGSKNINLARNIFTQNEDKYEYNLLQENDNFNFDDDELYTENNFLLNMHKKFKSHKFSIFCSVPLGVTSLYFKFISKSQLMFNLSLLICGAFFIFNWNNFIKKEKVYKSEFYTMLSEANQKSIEIYKIFYYD